MTAPTFVTASAGATDTGGAWNYIGSAAGAAGRLILLMVLSDGTTNGASDMTPTSATNIEALDGTANTWTRIPSAAPAGFPIGSPTAALFNLFVGRSTGAVAFSAAGNNVGGDDLYFRAYEFTGANTGTGLNDVFENGTVDFETGSGIADVHASGTSTGIAHDAVTTNGSDRLALCCVGVNDDNAVGDFTGESGGAWALAVAAYVEPGGTDATIALQSAAMASAGTISGGGFTMAASDGWGTAAFAIIGTTVAAGKGIVVPRRSARHLLIR